MWKPVIAALLSTLALAPAMAQANTFDRGLNTMWESLWHQSGVPTRLLRWEQDIRVRVHGSHAAGHRAHAVQALREAGAAAGVKVTDITDGADAARQANVHVEITADHALSDAQPCETRLNYADETTIHSATLQMRAGDAQRCAHHEAMHVLGVRGHPEGDTVLSYFTSETHRLSELDQALLRGWYSPRARAGMTPFEVLPILADELVAISPDAGAARLARDRFLAGLVQQMQAFAAGSGDIPAIVKRSGKSSSQGVQFGRVEMSYFLGVAYEQGAVVSRDPQQANQWLQRAAHMGSRPALARLGAARR